MARNPRPPAHLKGSAEFWRTTIKGFSLDDHHLKLLAGACECLDRATAAREVIDRDGQTFVDRFGQPKERPEVGIELANKTLFARLVRELALDGAAPAEAHSRSPRLSDADRRRA